MKRMPSKTSRGAVVSREIIIDLRKLKDHGKHVQCKVEIETILTSHKGKIDDLILLELLVILSDCNWYLGLFKDVALLIEKSKSLIQKHHLDASSSLVMELCIIEAKLEWKDGNTYHSKDKLEKLVPYLQSSGEKHLFIHAILTLSGVCYVSGQRQTALEHASAVINYSREISNLHTLVSAMRLKGLIYWQSSDYERAMTTYDECLLIATEKGFDDQISHVLNNKGLVFWEQGDLDQALQHFRQATEIANQLQLLELRAITLNNIGLILMEKTQLDEALEYFEESFALFKRLNNRFELARSHRNVGVIHLLKGDLDAALVSLRKSLELREDVGNSVEIADSLNLLGKCHRSRGEFTIALEYYERCQQLWKQSSNIAYQAIVLNNMGEIYLDRGELSLALEHCKESLRLRERIGNRLSIGNSYLMLGKLYLRMGKQRKAIRYLERCLEFLDTLNVGFEIAEALFYLILVHSLRNEKQRVREVFFRLGQLHESTSEKMIGYWYELAKGMSFKHSPRKKNKFFAQKIFEDLALESDLPNEVLIISLLNSCELMLFEIETFGEAELLGEMEERLELLARIAESQHSYWLMVETYFLKAKFSLLQNDEQGALHLLEETRKLAEKHQLEALSIAIANEQLWFIEYTKLLREMEMGNDEYSLRERIEAVRFAETFSRLLGGTTGKISQTSPSVLFAVLVTMLDDGLKLCAYHSPEKSGNFELEEQQLSWIVEAVHLDNSRLVDNDIIIWRVTEYVYCLSYRFRVSPPRENTDHRYEVKGVPLDCHVFVHNESIEPLYKTVPSILKQLSLLKLIVKSVSDTYYHEMELSFVNDDSRSSSQSIKGKAFRSFFSQLINRVDSLLSTYK